MKGFSSHEEQWRALAQIKSNEGLKFSWRAMKSHRSFDKKKRAFMDRNEEQ